MMQKNDSRMKFFDVSVGFHFGHLASVKSRIFLSPSKSGGMGWYPYASPSMQRKRPLPFKSCQDLLGYLIGVNQKLVAHLGT